ncbi:ATP-binding cassette domain-containing protein [Eubacteriales bacterium OttesenSCG-928-A19]|nr:ATP-binding cassette domain-containing protein [Eubacteriales bacterium OttesenSCG-928-A19]
MGNDSHTILEVNHLNKSFPIKKGIIRIHQVGEVRAVNDVSFSLPSGETLGVIGESGCGKSTLARLVLGLIEKNDGEILLEGQPVSTDMPPSMRRNVQMIFQDPYSSIDPRMNVRRIIEEPLRVYTKMSRAEKLEVLLPILEKVGLSDDVLEKYPHEFSGGQRQRIGIARALVLNPALVLCDEPVSALDVSIQAQILNLFRDLQQALGLTYLFISHDMSVIRHVSDRIAVMYLGNIVELAPKRTLFVDTLHPYSIALMSAIPVPDPSLRRQRILLEGDLPSPLNLPKGCPFASRCSRVKSRCVEEKPALREVQPGHFVACHFIDGEGVA